MNTIESSSIWYYDNNINNITGKLIVTCLHRFEKCAAIGGTCEA